MKLTLTTLAGEIVSVDVPDDMSVGDLRALCQIDCPSLQSHAVEGLVVKIDGNTASDVQLTAKLKDTQLKDNSMLLITPPPSANPFANLDFSSIQVPQAGSSRQRAQSNHGGQGLASQDPATVRELLLKDANAMATLKQQNPPLHDAIISGDLAKFSEILKKQVERRKEDELKRIRMLSADPFDAEAQRLIEQEIQQQNIEHQLETAMEHTPENFGTVTMLYIKCRVNGHDIKAFVDSGAQSTIMSSTCAQRCNIDRLIDKRFSGIAKGVGTQKILGRIHSAHLHIENDHLPVSFTILEDQSMDVLLGLDMLKRHQCCIDLKRGCLVIGTTGTKTEFLHEGELPHHAKLNHNDNMDEDEQLANAINASASSSSTASDVSTNAVDESKIVKLVGMGFLREAAIKALQANGGEVDKAAIALLATKLGK